MSKSSFDAALKEITKKYGETALIDPSKDQRLEVETIPTGLPSLDLILGGGFPKGRIIEVYGPESSGKSTMALHMMKHAQQDEPDRKVAYIDAENAFDPDYAKSLGIDLSKMFLNQPDSGEEALDIVEKLCQTGKISVIVIDSVANLVPSADSAKEIDATVSIGTRARLLSQHLPRLANAAKRSNTVIVFINQIRMKIGMLYGNPETTTGGMALKFNASIRLEVRGKKDKERPGMIVKCTAKKNKIAPPGRTTEIFLEYGKGFDEEGDLIETAAGLGLITRAGAWYQYGEIKEQGLQSLVDAIKADKKVFANLKKEVKDAAKA